MYRFGAGVLDRLHDLVDHDVGLVGGRRADVDSFIRHLHMQRIAVRIRIDGDRLDPHLFGRLDHAAGDFAAVGDQNFLEHSLPLDSTTNLPECSGGFGPSHVVGCLCGRRGPRSKNAGTQTGHRRSAI